MRILISPFDAARSPRAVKFVVPFPVVFSTFSFYFGASERKRRSRSRRPDYRVAVLAARRKTELGARIRQAKIGFILPENPNFARAFALKFPTKGIFLF